MSLPRYSYRSSRARIDLLTLLAHSWIVEGVDEIDALFNAMERASGIPRMVFEASVVIEQIDRDMYKIINKNEKSYIIARVMREHTREYGDDIIIHVLGIGRRSTNRFIVTFYPQSYRRQ